MTDGEISWSRTGKVTFKGGSMPSVVRDSCLHVADRFRDEYYAHLAAAAARAARRDQLPALISAARAKLHEAQSELADLEKELQELKNLAP